MGTSTASGFFNPAIGELGWGAAINAGTVAHEAYPSHITLGADNVGAFWLNPNGGNDGGPAGARGRFDTAYRTVGQVKADHGTEGIRLRCVPAAVQAYILTDAAGNLTRAYLGTDVFTGQVIDLANETPANTTIQIPTQWDFRGGGVAGKDSTYVTLIKGNVAGGPLIQVGSTTGSPSSAGCTVKDFALTNINATGDGIGILKGATGATIDNVTAFANGRHGYSLLKTAMDGVKIVHPMAFFNGQGLSGTGMGFFWSSSNGSPNNVVVEALRSTGNVYGELLLRELSAGHGGYVAGFIAPRFGNNGIILSGEHGGEFKRIYQETNSGLTVPFITVDSDTQDGTTFFQGWTLGGGIYGAYLHGGSLAFWSATTTVLYGQFTLPSIGNSNGHRYRCITTGGGPTGGAEPIWPTGAGATVTDGSVTWQEFGTQNVLVPNAPIVPGNAIGQDIHVFRGFNFKALGISYVGGAQGNAQNPRVYLDDFGAKDSEIEVILSTDGQQSQDAAGPNGSYLVYPGHPSNRVTYTDRDVI